MVVWTAEFTDQFRAWFEGLSEEEKASIRASVRVLRERGPALGRPLVDRVEGSAYHNMKELRPVATNIRILFAFDPRRTAFLLLGGDKTGLWNRWYDDNIPIADALYAEHLHSLEAEAKKAEEIKGAMGKRDAKKGRKR